MKKNKMFILGLLTLFVAVLSLSLVSGTYAKYVTSDDGSDTARVAKWGVTVSGTADTFKQTYAKDGTSTLEGNTVVSTQDVVAPGTSGSMAAFTIAGTPEVAVRVAFTGTLELGANWVDSTSVYYCPIEITVGDTTYKGTTYGSADEFEAAVNAKIATYKKDYAAGTDLSGITADAPTISWKWAFEGNDDVKDTYLGSQAVTPDKAATISLAVTVTVTQID